jgi:Tfp pilus assembly protein PilN
MGGFDLNLSTRPFPAYRATNIALTIGLLALLGVSAWQAQAYLHYSASTRQILAEERNLNARAQALAGQVAELSGRLDRPEAAAKLKEIDYLNNLIARKGFSWTRIFATLERIVPDSVHLTTLRPEIQENGRLRLRIDARGRSVADISDFIDLLQESKVFEEVNVSYDEKVDENVAPPANDVNAALTMVYIPERDVQ